MTTGKTIALTRQTFLGKEMALIFNMLSRLEKEMAIHSSVLAWRIPWAEESDGQQCIGADMTEQLTTSTLSSVQSLSRVKLSATL